MLLGENNSRCESGAEYRGFQLFRGCDQPPKMNILNTCMIYSKTCLKRPLKKITPKLVFNTDYRLMQVKSITE